MLNTTAVLQTVSTELAAVLMISDIYLYWHRWWCSE